MIIIKNTSIEIHIGINGFSIFEIGCFETLDATNKVIPTGGVLIPIARLTTQIIPKWIGSIPNCWATGSKIGVLKMMAGVESIIIPRNRNSILAIIRNTTGDELMLSKKLVACSTIRCEINPHAKTFVVATQNITAEVVSTLSATI